MPDRNANRTGSQQHCCGDRPKWSHRLLLDALNPTVSEPVTAPERRSRLLRITPLRSTWYGFDREDSSAYTTGSNFEISHEPPTFVSVIRTLLGVISGCGLSLLIVASFRNTSTTAEFGSSSDTAALTTEAVCAEVLLLHRRDDDFFGELVVVSEKVPSEM